MLALIAVTNVGVGDKLMPHNPGGGMQEMRGLTTLCSLGFRPQRVLDIGANRGDWTRSVLTMFPHAQFVMIEANIEHAQNGRYRDLLRRGNVTALSAILHDSSHNVTWNMMKKGKPGTGDSIFQERTRHYFANGVQLVRQTVKLDELLRQHRLSNAFDLVKLDIQGAAHTGPAHSPLRLPRLTQRLHSPPLACDLFSRYVVCTMGVIQVPRSPRFEAGSGCSPAQRWCSSSCHSWESTMWVRRALVKGSASWTSWASRPTTSSSSIGYPLRVSNSFKSTCCFCARRRRSCVACRRTLT